MAYITENLTSGDNQHPLEAFFGPYRGNKGADMRADEQLSHETYNLPKAYEGRCVSEFYNQGDLEKERGMPVLGFMDREVDYLPKSQIGFTKFVVVPMFKTLEQVYPTVVPSLLENISNNIQRWEWYKDGCGDSAEKMKDQQAALVNDEVLQSLDAPAYEGGKVYAPPRV